MTGLIRYCRGWVRFRVTGGFPERFINLCAMRGFALWDMHRSGEVFTFCTQTKSYAKLRPCARSAGVKMKVTERGGLPFVLHRHRKRRGLAAGLVMCVLLLAAASRFVWRVEVVGNSRLDDRIILESLVELGVKPGAYINHIDVRSVERRLMMELQDLGWAAVNLQGSTAVVQVQERVMPPEILDRQQPCNVVAARGGQIVEARVYVGQSMVTAGDAVAAGDILVSGVVEDEARDMHLVAARADIIAETNRTLRAEVELKQTRYTLRKVIRRYSLKAGSLEIPLWIGKKPEGIFRLERMYRPLRLFGHELPLQIGKRRYLLLQQETTLLTRKEAVQRAENQLKLQEKELGAEEVLLCEKQLHQSADRVVLQADYILLENIACQSEIFTDDPQE